MLHREYQSSSPSEIWHRERQYAKFRNVADYSGSYGKISLCQISVSLAYIYETASLTGYDLAPMISNNMVQARQ